MGAISGRVEDYEEEFLFDLILQRKRKEVEPTREIALDMDYWNKIGEEIIDGALKIYPEGVKVAKPWRIILKLRKQMKSEVQSNKERQREAWRNAADPLKWQPGGKKKPSQCEVTPEGCRTLETMPATGKQLAVVGATPQTSKPSSAENKEPVESPMPSQRDGRGRNESKENPKDGGDCTGISGKKETQPPSRSMVPTLTMP